MMAIHFAHRCGQMTYREIAATLDMNHYSAVASSMRRLQNLCRENNRIRQLRRAVQADMRQRETYSYLDP